MKCFVYSRWQRQNRASEPSTAVIAKWSYLFWLWGFSKSTSWPAGSRKVVMPSVTGKPDMTGTSQDSGRLQNRGSDHERVASWMPDGGQCRNNI